MAREITAIAPRRRWRGSMQTISPVETSVLNSWKEIARYLGRGVRTAQRWERELGLPVRRPRNHLRSPVIAIPAEIDAWLRRVEPPATRPPGTHKITARDLERSAKALLATTEIIRRRAEQLQGQITRSIALGKKLTERSRQRVAS